MATLLEYLSGSYQLRAFQELQGHVNKQMEERKKQPLPLREFIDVRADLVIAFLIALYLVIFPVLAWLLPLETFGWICLGFVITCTLSGFHLVFTHVHLFCTAAILLTNDTFALSVCACLGFNIACAWYATIIGNFRANLVNRAFFGWGKWIWTDLAGISVPLNFSYVPQASIACWFGTFHLVDIAFHFLPPLMLMQLAADHITIWSVFTAYFCARLWTIFATAHHCVIDWTHFRASGFKRVVVRRLRSEKINAFAEAPVMNLIYGFQPDLRSRDLMYCITFEALGTIIQGIFCLLPKSYRYSAFWVLGGGAVADLGVMKFAGVVCVMAGVSLAFTGVVVALAASRKGK